MLSTNVLQHGRETPLVKLIPLQAGPFTLSFDPVTAFLRYIRLGDHEVVRSVYGTVRDRNWETILPTVSRLEVRNAGDSFHLSCDLECREGEIAFSWRTEVEGSAEGEIHYRFEGKALSSFLRNRIGLCVHHPILECAGRACRVEKVDGTCEEAVFPRQISPHQPFKNIRAISYEVAPGQRAEVRFEGEVFEMEDQRNWTDASFKTYPTPLDLPFPVQVEKGAALSQSVTISPVGPTRKILPVLLGRGAQLSISTTPVLAMPPLGFSLAESGSSLSGREIERFKLLSPAHLQLNLRLQQADYPNRLEQAAAQATQIGAGLQLALTVSDQAETELNGLLAHLNRLKPPIRLWMIFHHQETVTSPRWVALARQSLQAYAPNILIAAGTRLGFVEVNRLRPPPEASALPCYGINPQCHAFDNSSLVENLAAQSSTVETAAQFSPRPAVVSPITLGSSRIASPPEKSPAGGGALPWGVDPRQMSLFGAAWTLGSVARLASSSNVHSLTYYETTGRRGLMESEAGTPGDGEFPSLPGAVFPVYHFFADLADCNRLYPTHSSHPLQVEGMTLLNAQGQRRVLVANLLGEPQEVKIKTGTCRGQIRYLDETNAEHAMRNPEQFRAEPGQPTASVSGKIELKLLPYAIARVDLA